MWIQTTKFNYFYKILFEIQFCIGDLHYPIFEFNPIAISRREPDQTRTRFEYLRGLGFRSYDLGPNLNHLDPRKSYPSSAKYARER